MFFIFSMIVVGLLPGCGCSQKAAAQKKQGLFVINVLDKATYDDAHIKGSVHVPFDDVAVFAADLDADNAEIVVYCSNYMCTSSDYVAKRLQALGFKKVWAYEGGMAEWYQLGLPVEGPAKLEYLSKKIEKPAEQESSTVQQITADELAHKLGVVKKSAA